MSSEPPGRARRTVHRARRAAPPVSVAAHGALLLQTLTHTAQRITHCCSAVLVGTKRILGLDIACKPPPPRQTCGACRSCLIDDLSASNCLSKRRGLVSIHSCQLCNAGGPCRVRPMQNTNSSSVVCTRGTLALLSNQLPVSGIAFDSRWNALRCSLLLKLRPSACLSVGIEAGRPSFGGRRTRCGSAPACHGFTLRLWHG